MKSLIEHRNEAINEKVDLILQELGHSIERYDFYSTPYSHFYDKGLANQYRSRLDDVLTQQGVFLPIEVVYLLQVIPFNGSQLKKYLYFCLEHSENITHTMVIERAEEYARANNTSFDIHFNWVVDISKSQNDSNCIPGLQLICEYLKNKPSLPPPFIKHIETDPTLLFSRYQIGISRAFLDVDGNKSISNDIGDRLFLMLYGKTVDQVRSQLRLLEQAIQDDRKMHPAALLQGVDMIDMMSGAEPVQYKGDVLRQMYELLKNRLDAYILSAFGKQESFDDMRNKEEILSNIFGKNDLVRRYFRFHFLVTNDSTGSNLHKDQIKLLSSWERFIDMEQEPNYRHVLDIDIHTKIISLSVIRWKHGEKKCHLWIPKERKIDLGEFTLSVGKNIILHEPEQVIGTVVYI